MERKETSAPEEKVTQSATDNSRKRKITKLREGINKLPDKKPHLDFLAGLLTIPLLIVTLILNWNSLTARNAASKLSSTPSPAPTIIYKNRGNITPLIVTTKPQPTSQDQCVKDIGPISISYPQEGQTVSDNPICIGIDYQAGNYCSVVWAYQIDGGALSDYSNNSVCLSNLPSGNHSFVLHIKSLSSSSTKTLTRNFTYKNNNATPTPVSTATVTPTQPSSPTPTQ